jgi:hypothetical protein
MAMWCAASKRWPEKAAQYDSIPGLPVYGNAQRSPAHTRPNMNSRSLQVDPGDFVAAT